MVNSPVVSLSNKLYFNYLVLVGSRNGFERDFTTELKSLWKVDLNVVGIHLFTCIYIITNSSINIQLCTSIPN